MVQVFNGGPPNISGAFVLATSGNNSPITFNQVAGSISNSSQLLLPGVRLVTSGTNSPIVFNQTAGASINSTQGNGLELLATRTGSNINGTVNGTVTTTANLNLMFVQLAGTGAVLDVDGGGSVGSPATPFTFGASSVVSGFGGGIFAVADGPAGSVDLVVNGTVNQTGTGTVFVTSSTLETGNVLGIGIYGHAQGDGHVAITTGSAAAINTAATGGIGILSVAQGAGDSTVNFGGTITANNGALAGIAATSKHWRCHRQYEQHDSDHRR